MQQQAGEGKYRTPYQQLLHTLVVVPVLHNQLAEKESDENMGDGGDGTEQALGIECNAHPFRSGIFEHVSGTPQCFVHHGNDVPFRHLKPFSKSEKQVISGQ